MGRILSFKWVKLHNLFFYSPLAPDQAERVFLDKPSLNSFNRFTIAQYARLNHAMELVNRWREGTRRLPRRAQDRPMRAIGIVNTEPYARRLSDYLLTLGIASQIELSPDGYCVWVQEEDKVDLARKELATFLEDPENLRYQTAAPLAALLRHKDEVAERKYRKNWRDIRGRWRRPSPRSCPLTILLITISIVVAVASRMGEQIDPVLNYLFMTEIRVQGERFSFRTDLPEIRHGEVWRLVSPIFIHFGPMHLLFNLWCLYNLGGVIEMQRGTWRLMLLVIVSAVISNLAQCYWSNPLFGGMSGVLYTLFGYTWMKSRSDASAGLYIPSDTVTLMIIWLFLCMTGAMGNIANVAHVTGLIAGIILGLASVVWRKFLRK